MLCLCLLDNSWILTRPHFKVVLDAGDRERICAYHTSLSSSWQESACSSVGERTCIQRGEERRSERNSGRMVGGGEGEKKLMPARHPIWGRFWWWSQRFHCSKHSFITLFVCACTRVMSVLMFLCSEDRVDVLFCPTWPRVKLNVFCSWWTTYSRAHLIRSAA